MSDATLLSDLTPPLKRRGSQRHKVTKRPLLPKDEASRNVFAEPELFEAWTIISKFHSEAFKEAGVREGVSRNDMMVHYLRESAVEYWLDKGGFPADAADWKAKVLAYAKRVAEMKKAAAEKRDEASDRPNIADMVAVPKK
jgi:hypothetical protein